MSKCPVPANMLGFFFGLPIPYKQIIALCIALFIDALDLLALGLIPLLSLVIDLIGLAILIPFAGVPVLLAVFEVLPENIFPPIGLFPTFVGAVIISIFLENMCMPKIPHMAYSK